MGVGIAPSTGAVVSWTVTVNVPEAEFKCASVAVHVTVFVPIANVVPEAGAHVGVTEPSTRSVAEAANVTLAPEVPVASAVMLAGSVIAGAVVSTTVTEKVAVTCVLSPVSVAVHVTVVGPRAKVLPGAGTQPTTPRFSVSVAEGGV
jgi:hypothetical protein